MDVLWFLQRQKRDFGGSYAQAGASMIDTAETNAVNMYEAQQNREFNSEEANAQRAWSANQAAIQQEFNANQAQLNRRFQSDTQLQAQDYNARMSDTAIQRRAEDIQKAGFNPLLAVSQLGGASTPMASGLGGSMAQSGLPGGASASSNAMPQIGSYMQNLNQSKLANAQTANVKQNTNKQKAETGIAEAQEDMWAMDTTPEMLMKRQQMVAQQYDLEYAKASQVNEAVNMIKQASDQADLKTQFGRVQNQMQLMDRATLQATYQELIKMQNAVYAQQTQEAQNVTAAQSGMLGKTIAYAQAILTPVSTAAGAASHAAGAAKDLVGWGGAMP